MKFRTELHLKKSDINIRYSDTILLLGSCFSQNIGYKLQQIKYATTVNPLGIVYHPIPLHRSIIEALQNKKIEHIDLNKNSDDLYTAWNIHSRLSSLDAHEALSNMNKGINTLCQSVKKANYLILTYGTALGYHHKEYGAVANCHKFPASDFKKELSSPSVLIDSFDKMHATIKSINPNLKILLTVSPVRHIKDGIVENSRSKAHLITAVHDICEQNENCRYLPSYELLMDDLRDYRYYADDMVHPSDKAIDYIWSKISDHLLDTSESSLRSDIAKIVRAASHRPFNAHSEQYQSFLKSQISLVNKILTAYPSLDFTEELKIFEN